MILSLLLQLVLPILPGPAPAVAHAEASALVQPQTQVNSSASTFTQTVPARSSDGANASDTSGRPAGQETNSAAAKFRSAPIMFVENKGQLDARAKCMVQGAGARACYAL